MKNEELAMRTDCCFGVASREILQNLFKIIQILFWRAAFGEKTLLVECLKIKV